MKKHLGKVNFLSGQNIPNDRLLFDSVERLVFNFSDYSIDINTIKNIALTYDENIIIETLVFDNNLYNAYINDDIIVSLVERGKFLDMYDAKNKINYEILYKNYKIKCVTGSKTKDGEGSWLYVIEPYEISE